jgi:alanine racemase
MDEQHTPRTITAPALQASSRVTASSDHSWIEISTAALRHNFHAIQARVGSQVSVCPVIKSNAYGHGITGCALALRNSGAKWLAVSTVAEGVTLRQAGIQERILVLGGFWRGEEEEIIRQGLTPAVWERSRIELLQRAADAIKPSAGSRPRVHLKINTGMNRLGADVKDLPNIFEAMREAREVVFEGIFSHFASSEVVDLPHGEEQLRQFGEAVRQTEANGFKPIIRHMANSAAIAGREGSWYNLVRPGLAVYGYCLPLTSTVPGKTDLPQPLPLQPAITWKTRVLQVRDVAAGEQIGYSSGHVTKSPTRVAVLAVGYGDGLSRRLSSRGRVIIRDSYAAILGNVSMNLTAIDVTGIPGVEMGDEAIIIGQAPRCQITVWEHATLASTIPYEILCNITGRLPRKYVE